MRDATTQATQRAAPAHRRSRIRSGTPQRIASIGSCCCSAPFWR